MDADSAGLCVGFICLVSHSRTRVILPLAAACHSRMLQGLLQAIHLSCAADDPGSLSPPRLPPPLSRALPSKGPSSTAEESEEGQAWGEGFGSFAAAYPYLGPRSERCAPFLSVPLYCMEMDTLVRIADFLVRKTCEGYVVAKRQRQILEYQRSREGCRNTSSDAAGALELLPEELRHPVECSGEIAVLKDLDRTSQEDQLKAIQLLLGSDFLGC